MKPFADDSASTSVGDLSAENGSNSITLTGSLEIRRDKAGMKRAQALKALADAIVEALQAGDLPEHVAKAAGNSETVANPFT
ncbi:MAG: hypothetical protein EOO77_21205 [Oxalobacteraceae bacterium]|nr:MAG: hypothetical protein EOO77_21205 [Oxalobacteraceae bacterium]